MNKLKIPAFKLIGIKLDKKTTNTHGQSSIDCGNLWQQFKVENYLERIPHTLSDEIYAVYYEYEGKHMDPFSYFIGSKVEMDAETPKSMHSLVIPEQTYSEFLAKGVMPDCISDIWKEIWSSNMERNYQFDFELYDERSKDWSNAEVKIFIS